MKDPNEPLGTGDDRPGVSPQLQAILICAAILVIVVAVFLISR